MKIKIENILQILRKELPLLINQYNVKSLEIFGSYLRNEQKQTSDLDLLVTFSENPGLLKFLELENYLSDKLEVKVDLVMKDSLKPRIGKSILKEAQPI
ncbi:MAG: nucleotidyltransferase family protein [bacterium]